MLRLFLNELPYFYSCMGVGEKTGKGSEGPVR